MTRVARAVSRGGVSSHLAKGLFYHERPAARGSVNTAERCATRALLTPKVNDMSTRQFAIAVAIAATLGVPSVSHADTPNSSSCFLDDGRVVAVTPYYGKPKFGGAALQTLRGAQVQLMPTTGLTSEYLEARLQRLLDARQHEPLPGCLIDVGHVHIESTPLGEATSVTLVARDPSQAEKVYRRARLLLDE